MRSPLHALCFTHLTNFKCLQLQLLTRPIRCHRTLTSRDAESACSGCMQLQGRERRRIQRLVRLATIVGTRGTTSAPFLVGRPGVLFLTSAKIVLLVSCICICGCLCPGIACDAFIDGPRSWLLGSFTGCD